MRRFRRFSARFFALLGILLASPPMGALAQTAPGGTQPSPPDWADPFCSVSQVLTYWDSKTNKAVADAPDALVGRLWAPSASASAHITLITATDAYDANVTQQPLTGTTYMHFFPAISHCAAESDERALRLRRFL
ncbi:MAG TPA: hypothetical protein VGF18_10520 [Candidatus Tumulicola sp.]|jgi:hypothetical protein